MSRTITIAGNWKLNKTATEAAALAGEIAQTAGAASAISVIIAPPFTALAAAGAAIKNSAIKLAAQDVSEQTSGAYTGEVSAAMLLDLGVTHVIIGHSERREYYGETDAIVNKKVLAALAAGLSPIVCVGETLEKRSTDKTFDFITRQIGTGLANIPADKFASVIVAYEPVWAIGTGKTASPEQAQEVHGFIRGELSKLQGRDAADKTSILYGGSMKPDNALALLAEEDIDGGLIGGAALKAADFAALVEAGKAAAAKKG